MMLSQALKVGTTPNYEDFFHGHQSSVEGDSSESEEETYNMEGGDLDNMLG
jgi:hypothetical protein